MDQERDFTREPIGRFEWERILRRIRVSVPSVKLVGFAMATYASADGSNVRPGQRRLAAVLGTSEMTVRRGQSELEAVGMLDMVFKGRSLGRGQSGGYASEYRLTVPSDLLERVPMLDPDEGSDRTPVSGESPKDRTPTSGESQEVPDVGEEVPDTREETPDMQREIPDTHVPPPQHTHHNKDQIKEHQSLSVAQADVHTRQAQQGEIEIDFPTEEQLPSKAALAKQMAEDFNEWYAAYPRHEGRGAAVNAYARARKKASVEELLEGAKSYMMRRKGEDPKFTKTPAPWLNQECWSDEAPQAAVLGPWSKQFHQNGRLSTSQKMAKHHGRRPANPGRTQRRHRPAAIPMVQPTQRTRNPGRGAKRMTAYIPPSQCWQCVPIETVTTQSSTTWTVDLAHERACPNNPKEMTK